MGMQNEKKNEELYQLYTSTLSNMSIISTKNSKLRWAANVKRVDENELARRIMECKPEEVLNRV